MIYIYIFRTLTHPSFRPRSYSFILIIIVVVVITFTFSSSFVSFRTGGLGLFLQPQRVLRVLFIPTQALFEVFLFRLLLFRRATTFVPEPDAHLVPPTFAGPHDAADDGVDDATDRTAGLFQHGTGVFADG